MARRKNKSRVKTWKDPRVGDMALWIMTPFGILMPSKRPADLVAEGDPRTLQVRARHREYLDKFREVFCPELGESEHHTDQDYPWKAAVSPDDLARAVSRMVLEIDSEKFKPLAEDSRYALPGKLGRDLHSQYNTMWSTHLKYGDGTSSYDKPWSGSQAGITACRKWGHWWPPNAKVCKDCGEPNPSWPKAGPTGVKPAAGAVPKPAPGYPHWDPESCKTFGHEWPAKWPSCKFCGEPRPKGRSLNTRLVLKPQQLVVAAVPAGTGSIVSTTSAVPAVLQGVLTTGKPAADSWWAAADINKDSGGTEPSVMAPEGAEEEAVNA